MTSNFTPKQLNINPALGREKAEARLTVYGDRPENFAVKQSWYLVQHADVTGRLNGEAALAYRKLSGYQLAKLVCEIANGNIMGADVIDYMYKFLGISREVVAEQPAPTPVAAPDDSDLPFATFDDTVDTVQDSAAETCTCGEPLTVREEVERGFCVYCAYDYEKSEPTPPVPATRTARFQNTGGGKIATGHNRGKKRTQSQKSAPVERFKANKVSTIMMERNTPKNGNKAKRGLTQGLIRQQYAVAQIEYRRQREIEMAQAIENARRIVTINRQMSALGVAA